MGVLVHSGQVHQVAPPSHHYPRPNKPADIAVKCDLPGQWALQFYMSGGVGDLGMAGPT